MDLQIIQNNVEEILHLINIIMAPNFNADDHKKANARLNDIIQNEIPKNFNLFLDVAMVLLHNINGLDENSSQVVACYGFNILEKIIQYQWYKLRNEIKENLKNFAMKCLETNLSNLKNQSCSNKFSISTLILNTCSRMITEIFIREWPNNWMDFLPKITTNLSLVALYTFINISDYLQKLYLPPNSNRRKEITKMLTSNSDVIFDYFSRCIRIINDSSNEPISLELKKLILIRGLEVLELYLEWFPLNENILIEMFSIATKPIMDINDEFSLRIKKLSFRCLQTSIKRQQKRLDDTIILNNIFYDLNQEKFSHHLVTQMLEIYFNLYKSNEYNSEIFELFLILLDMSIEIVCHVINLFNQESTHKSIKDSCINNQLFWSKFIAFSLDCLQYNNVNLDEVLLRFFILYSRSNNSSLMNDDSKDGDPNKNSIFKKLNSPISSDLCQSLPLKLMIVIGLLKLEPKSESCATELTIMYNIDSYESYLRSFNDNRFKFINILKNFLQTDSNLGCRFLFSLLKDLFGFIPDCNLKLDMIDTNIKSWNVAATLCSTLIPKLDLSIEHIKILEIYFSRLLEINFDLNVTDIKTINGVLSCISSMSSFYKSFSAELIKKLIDVIFSLIVKTGQNSANNSNVNDLQNHTNALFIKLCNNCVKIFLPYFQMMRAFIENLIETQQIGLVQSYFLYEGLFILSNHLPLEEQRSFIIDNIMPKISLTTLTTYDLAKDKTTFFKDIGLSEQPLLNVNELPFSYNPTLIKISVASNLIIRLLKRINSNRYYEILWPKILDYITPFFKIIALIHDLWCNFHEKNLPVLEKQCHPIYQRFIFEEFPFYYISMICHDQTNILAVDRYKSLIKNWDRKSPPSLELIGYHMQQKLWIMYSQSFTLLNTTINYLFYFYEKDSNLESIIENYINVINSSICLNMKFMPLCVYHEIIRLYFQTLVNYCPRSEKFLINSGSIETIIQFMEFMFVKLDENLKKILQDKDNHLANSEPKPIECFQNNLIMSFDNRKNCYEILLEAIINSICGDFVLFLNAIFSTQKNVCTIFSTNESFNQQNHEMDEQMDDGDDEDNELVINTNLLEPSSINNNENNEFNDEGFLSKFIFKHNPKPLALVVIGCLQWPINNLKLQICNVNQKLLYSLISRNMITTMDSFFDLSERVLFAISRIEKTDAEMFNRYVNLLLIIYENVAVKNNLTEPINTRLSQICGSDLYQWNKFSQCFYDGTNNVKKAQKMLRVLVENISMQHSVKEQPTVLCLGKILDRNRQDKNDNADHQFDVGFLSWLK